MNQYDENNEKVSSSGVKFNEEQQRTTRSSGPKIPKIVQWVIESSGGLVKNEKQAVYVLIGFVIVAFIISLFLIFSGGIEKLTSEEQLFLDTPSFKP